MKLRPQLLIGFLSLTALILLMGIYGGYSLERIYALTRAMYDGPLMSINYARSAQHGFTRIEGTIFRLAVEPTPPRRPSRPQKRAFGSNGASSGLLCGGLGTSCRPSTPNP